MAVKSDLSGLTSQVNRGSPVEPVKDAQPVHQSEPLPDFVGTEDTVDAMGAVAFADEEDCGFFGESSLSHSLDTSKELIASGPSSNIAFLRHLSRAVAHIENTQKEITSPPMDQLTHDGGFINATRPSSPISDRTPGHLQGRQSNLFTLPSPEETLTLIHRYFSDTGLLFPYIYPPAFFETYSELTYNPKRIRRTWLGLLNMVLAMAKLTTVSHRSPAETCLGESAVYYRRAIRLCNGEMLRGTTLEVGTSLSYTFVCSH